MQKKAISFLRALIRFLEVTCLLTSITSCENFLTGEGVRNEIEQAIAYANAPSYPISVDYSGSCGVVKNPGGSKIEKKVSDVFTICFEPFTEFEFICWKIIDTKTQKEFQNGDYLTLKDIYNAETTCTFSKAPDNGISLGLYPVLADRPQIISNSPLGSGALKDSSINVIFDQDMDPFSIYFTDDEIKDLLAQGITKENFIPPLPDNDADSTAVLNHYGYKKNGEVYFKNIMIRNNRTGENINRCFTEPAFENKQTLVIPIIDPNSLDDYTQVLVNIDKHFFYTKQLTDTRQNINVEMKESKKWMYQVNSNIDNYVPTMGRSANGELFTLKHTNGDIIAPIEYLDFDNDAAYLSKLEYLKDKKINLSVQIEEPGNNSGPTPYFDLYITKITDENYKDIRIFGGEYNIEQLYPEPYKDPYKVYYQIVTSDVGIFNGEIDFSDRNPETGIYQLYCRFYDKRNNVLEYPDYVKFYFFAIDNEFTMPEPEIIEETGSEARLKLQWTPCIDLKKTEIRYKKLAESDWSETVTISRGTNYKIFDSLDYATEYEFDIHFYDYADHEKTFTPAIKTSDWGLSISGTPQKTLYFKGQDFDKTGLTVSLINSADGSSQPVDGWETNFDSLSPGFNKTVTIKYTHNGNTIYKDIETTYNIAAADAITETPEKIEDFNIEVNSNGEKIVTLCSRYRFGDFPQTISEHREDSFYSSEPVYNGWHLGADGYFYEKCRENAYSFTFSYSDHTVVMDYSDNSFRYFKVEPITWKSLNNNNQTLNLIAENNLTSNIPFYLDIENRTIGGQTIYPNNYKYSTIRAYLNGSYEADDTQQKLYEGKGFLQKAFSEKARNFIQTTEIDNSENYTNQYQSSSNYSFISNDYACPNTYDRIYLLSTYEKTMIADISNLFTIISKKTTDYTKANYFDDSNKECLRSPSNSSSSDNSKKVQVYASSYISNADVNKNSMIFSPCVTVSLEP